MRFLSALIIALQITPAFAAPLPEDLDGDGLLNHEEDLNGNGIVDSSETDSKNADTDGGGESDGSEKQAGRNPLNQNDDMTFDADGDGMSNGEETAIGTDPNKADSDDDGADDAADPFPLSDAYKEDKDKDGLPDEYEEKNKLSPQVRDDAESDPDTDGLTNREEFIQGTDPQNPDTDRDGVLDGTEVDAGTDPEESACLSYTGATDFFEDTEGHWAKTFVERLQRTKILPDQLRLAQGYTESGLLYFKPSQNITRFELLKLALLSSCIKLVDEEPTKTFSDVPTGTRRTNDDRELMKKVIYTAVKYGIVQGYADGTFKPHAAVTRSEALKMMLLASAVADPEDALSSKSFSDVSESDWFAPLIQKAVALDIIEGYEDGTFKPHNSITRAEAAKLIFLLMIMNPRVNGYVIPGE